MSRWVEKNMGWGSVLAAAVLLPGGSLLLAWAIYRRCFPKTTGRKL